MFNIRKKIKPDEGFALAYVLFMVAVLFFLGYALVMIMRQEAASSFTYLDANIAHFVAETGIEHALYVMKWHKYGDEIPQLGGPSSLDINKKFGAFQAFDNYSLPKDCPDDSWATVSELKSANIETKIKENIPEAKINFIKLKFDPQKNFGDDNLVFGIMTVSCQGEFRGVKRTVSVQKQVELYRDFAVMSDYCFAVNNSALEKIPARRENKGWFSPVTAGIPLPNLARASKFVPQDLIINNGIAWNADTRTRAKIYGRNLLVELNETRFPHLLGGFFNTGMVAMSGPAGTALSNFAKAFGDTSMLIKFFSRKVDGGVETSTSPFKDHIQHSVNPASLIGAVDWKKVILSPFDEAGFYNLCESDFPTGWSGLTNDLAGLISSTSGGTRGNIDFTGHFPTKDDWFSQIGDFLKKGFQSLFGFPPDEATTHNYIYGNVQRHYGQLESKFQSTIAKVGASILNFLTGGASSNFTLKVNDVIEQYSYDNAFGGGVDPVGVPPSVTPGKLPFVYSQEIYSLMAKRHNTIKSDIDAASYDTLKYKLGDIKYFDSTTNEKFFEDKKYKGETAWGLLKVEKEYKNVVWRPFWGWADNSEQCAKEFPWYTFSTSKNIFEAAAVESRFAIKVDGIHFVDGDVLIEGCYKGRGTIVATGNIIIGGHILRHTDDGVFDAGCERNPEFLRGCYNCLQLIALGTNNNSQAYPGVTGKIIFAPHAYDKRCFSGAFEGIQSYWSERPYVRVDAYIYGENGMMLDLDCVRDGFKFFGGSQDTFFSIFGNYTCQNLNWSETDAKSHYPDKTIINKFEKWCNIFEDIKAKKYCTINFSKRSDNFIQQRD